MAEPSRSRACGRSQANEELVSSNETTVYQHSPHPLLSLHPMRWEGSPRLTPAWLSHSYCWLSYSLAYLAFLPGPLLNPSAFLCLISGQWWLPLANFGNRHLACSRFSTSEFCGWGVMIIWTHSIPLMFWDFLGFWIAVHASAVCHSSSSIIRESHVTQQPLSFLDLLGVESVLLFWLYVCWSLRGSLWPIVSPRN